MLPKFSQIVNRLYAFIYETNHSKSGLGLPSIVALVMVIDKSWTSLGKHEKAFYTGLKKFVDDCKPLVDSAGNIRCPCKSCRLVLWVSIKHLSDHISKYGFDPSYKTWIHHGEPDLPPPPPEVDIIKKTENQAKMTKLSMEWKRLCKIKAKEVDINKKTENQAKMTKLSMEWKRLCKIKAKVQKCQSQSQYRRISSQTGAGTEEYYWMQS
ncbi:SRP72 RNA-binding domain-containing protein [Tanacetum coccineum]